MKSRVIIQRREAYGTEIIKKVIDLPFHIDNATQQATFVITIEALQDLVLQLNLAPNVDAVIDFKL